MSSLKMSGSHPANDNANGQHKEDHQRPGQGDLPEQQLDIYHDSILHDENYNQKQQCQPDICPDVHY